VSRRHAGARAALAAVLLLAAARTRAAGPLIVNGGGEPLVWTVDPVPFNPDRGSLGALDNATAIAHVAANLAAWEAVDTSTVRFADAGLLPVDVTKQNYASYMGVCGDGLSPIIFDTDGTITDDVFGAGASNSVLGFAGPDCGTFTPATITEGVAVLNGKWIDGISSGSNRELPLATFDGVFVHEFGHYVNLDHSQVGRVEAFDADPGNDDAIATMFPFLTGAGAFSTLALDDRVAVSTLYPAATFATDFATVTGRVLQSDGTTPFQGAYVIARRVGDPRITAVGAASGARYFPFASGGPPPAGLVGLYELPGLPPGDYTVEIEPIDGAFRGGSSVGPLDPPAALPGPPEFWNGVDEAGTDPPDDPLAATLLPVTAGTTTGGIDVVVNVPEPPTNDDCGAPVVIAATPYVEARATSTATAAPGDPQPPCTTDKNSNTVWYAYTPPSTGTVVVDTAGSSYDTVLTAYTGACGALVPVACDDDTDTLQAALVFPVAAGVTYLVEVADFGGPGGGTLHFALDLNLCGNGALDAGEACDAGAGNGVDGCCSAVCSLVDADGDGTCDVADVCPVDADPSQGDADGDGIGDACDLCATFGPGQTSWTRPRLTAAHVNDDRDGNDSLTLRGRFTVAGGVLVSDPTLDGAQVEVRSGSGVPRLRVTLPPGLGSRTVPGWSFRGRRYTFRDRRPGGTGGIGRMVVSDRGAGEVDVTVVVRKASLPLVPDDVPLAATVVLGGAPAGAAGACGEATFPGPKPAPACTVTRTGTRITCR
jgi:hypothetical protein